MGRFVFLDLMLFMVFLLLAISDIISMINHESIFELFIYGVLLFVNAMLASLYLYTIRMNLKKRKEQ